MLGALTRRRHGQPLVVLGVHTAKFSAEHEPERVARAMARHGVTHPVVLDERERIRRAYAVRAWPTLVVVRPDGTLAAVASGEAELEALDAFVGQVLDEARADGSLARAPYAPDVPAQPMSGAPCWPAKVIALPDGGLAVSDVGRHRVLLLDPDGRLRQTIGGDQAGHVDGPAARARLREPRGLACDGRRLFVADTGNHAVRALDLTRGVMGTVAGSGRLGREALHGTQPARDADLRSPWDLALAGDYLLVALAGSHQIAALDLEAETLRVLAGTGREGLADGPFHAAALAQPSGLALLDTRLYLADSENSALRYLDLAAGQARTLVGTGLFEFGNVDGPADAARLQHPMGVSHGPHGLLVADTLNDAIRRVDTRDGSTHTWFVEADGLTLGEPEGLCQLDDGRVVVADTNHGRLVLIAPDARSARALDLDAVDADRPASGAHGDGHAAHLLPRAQAAPGALTLRVRVELPAGCELAEGSRLRLRVRPGPGVEAPVPDVTCEAQSVARGLPLLLHADETAGDTWLELSAEALLRRSAASGAVPSDVTWRLPLRIDTGDVRRAVSALLVWPAPA